jgi:hypothetical protein
MDPGDCRTVTRVTNAAGGTEIGFRTVVEAAGKTATGLPVPDDVVERLGAGRRPSVTVTLGGHTYRSTIASMGGRFMLPLSGENRAAAGVAAGDEVDVVVALDDAPREVVVPDDLAAALQAAPVAAEAFARLSYSNQRRHVLAVDGAKTDATRSRRITKVVEELSAG